MIWLCIMLVLSVGAVNSGQNVDTSHIRVFPAMNQSIAGVFQVSYLDDQNQPQYAFNASEARILCSSLGVNIASKAEVLEALARGFESCRFGWVDEHFAVIPRIKALANCGQNRTGLLTWRAPVIKLFDVFCFNESDAVTQLKNIAPLSSRDYSSPPTAPSSTQTTHFLLSSLRPSSSSAAKTIDKEAEPAHFVSTAQDSAGAKAVLIASTCALLLIAIIIAAYLKFQKTCSRKSDMKQQQQESIETEEWTCAKHIEETQKDAQKEERIEVGDDAS